MMIHLLSSMVQAQDVLLDWGWQVSSEAMVTLPTIRPTVCSVIVIAEVSWILAEAVGPSSTAGVEVVQSRRVSSAHDLAAHLRPVPAAITTSSSSSMKVVTDHTRTWWSL
jgi:hypothetical protein